MRVLIAEDDPLCQMHARRIATQLGHEVAVAETGTEAWEQFVAFRPHVVVTDWLMPEVPGTELCRRIRDSESGADTYILMMTALESDFDRIEALEAGANDVLVKPITSEAVLQRLELARRVLFGASPDDGAAPTELVATVGRDVDSVRGLAKEYAERGDHAKARAFMARRLAAVESLLGPSDSMARDLRASLEAIQG